ncbi:hypothetical protein, partial [Caldithrix abyssi]
MKKLSLITLVVSGLLFSGAALINPAQAQHMGDKNSGQQHQQQNMQSIMHKGMEHMNQQNMMMNMEQMMQHMQQMHQQMQNMMQGAKGTQ